MPWIELTVDTSPEAVDWVTTLLAANGYDGEVAVASVADDGPWEFRVHFYLPPNGASRAIVERLAAALDTPRRVGLAGELHVEMSAERPARPEAPSPRRLGRRFVLLPADAPEPSDSDVLPLRIPAGLAFGSGLHPATVACLRLIERHARPDVVALDLGSGSGILTVALARLGAARVVALDNDPVAVAATGSAIVLNGVEAVASAAAGSLGPGGQLGHWMGWTELAEVPALAPDARFGFVVANILARVHFALADDYRRALLPGGVLLTGGFGPDAEAEVGLALARTSLVPLDRRLVGDYVALAHRG